MADPMKYPVNSVLINQGSVNFGPYIGFDFSDAFTLQNRAGLLEVDVNFDAVASDATPEPTSPTAGSAGSSALFSRADHVHLGPTPSDAVPEPTNVTAGSAGTSDEYSRADHEHLVVLPETTLPTLNLFSPASLTKILGASTTGASDLSFGWKFRVLRELVCTGIRFVTPATGFTRTMRCKLWNDTPGGVGTELASKDVAVVYSGSAGFGNGVIQEILWNTPQTLQADNLYTVSMYNTSANEWWTPANTIYGVWSPPSSGLPFLAAVGLMMVGPFFAFGDAYPVTNNGTFFPVEPILELP